MLNILHHHLNWIEALADLDQEAANAVFYNGLGGKDDNGKTERLGGGMGISFEYQETDNWWNGSISFRRISLLLCWVAAFLFQK